MNRNGKTKIKQQSVRFAAIATKRLKNIALAFRTENSLLRLHAARYRTHVSTTIVYLTVKCYEIYFREWKIELGTLQFLLPLFNRVGLGTYDELVRLQ